MLDFIKYLLFDNVEIKYFEIIKARLYYITFWKHKRRCKNKMHYILSDLVAFLKINMKFNIIINFI